MKKVALLIYSSPFHFPPTINAANLLSESGIEVHLIGIEYKDDWSQRLSEKVKLIYLNQQQTGWRGVTNYLKSIAFIRGYLRRHNIANLIGYDAKSVLPAFLSTWNRPVKWFYHQHDFWDNPKSYWEKFLWFTERKLVKHANCVSFPQLERAEFFKVAANLSVMPQIVFNGPRKNWIAHIKDPDPVITELRKRYQYLIIYQGGWSHFFGLERIFDALAECKTDTALVMLGEEREPGIRNKYLTHISKLGITDKVYLAEKYVAYEALAGFTCFCDAAVAILTNEDDPAPYNNRYLIGASNKITEYIACGLPVMIQDSSPNRRFLKQFDIGILIDSNNASLFAAAIDSLLLNPSKRKQINEYSKRLFIEVLNFDDQFGKIADRFL